VNNSDPEESDPPILLTVEFANVFDAIALHGWRSIGSRGRLS
jgi:hypothetical protein